MDAVDVRLVVDECDVVRVTEAVDECEGLDVDDREEVTERVVRELTLDVAVFRAVAVELKLPVLVLEASGVTVPFGETEEDFEGAIERVDVPVADTLREACVDLDAVVVAEEDLLATAD